MEKAGHCGLAFRNPIDVGDDDSMCPVTDSYRDFGWGLYPIISRRFAREIDQLPQSDGKVTRRQINETIDASVFDRWRRDKKYRTKNIAAWAARYKIDLETINTSVKATNPDHCLSNNFNE